MNVNGLPIARGQQSMAHGLQVLCELVDSNRPMTATELGERVGLHQSTVSRILSTFQAIGFVRKPDYHHFSVDLGLAVFAGRATQKFPMVRRALPVLQDKADQYAGYGLTLCALWRRELVILLKRDPNGEFHIMPSNRSPLHLAVAGLRHVLELDEAEALACLAQSREAFGWRRPTPNVPATPAATLAYARNRLDLDVLTLTDWAGLAEQKAAIPIRQNGQVAATLVLYGGRGQDKPDRTAALLHSIARDLEAAVAAATDVQAEAPAQGVHL